MPWVRLGQVAEWDFVEAPSQFIEEWIYDYGVLRRFAKHVETGEPVAVSLEYHDRDLKDLDTTKLVFELGARYSPSTGGTKPAAALVNDFLGRPFSFDAFREWLAPDPGE